MASAPMTLPSGNPKPTSSGIKMEDTAAPSTQIQELPDEMLLKVFSYVCLEDLLQTAYVCRRWYRLLKGTKYMWRKRAYVTEGILNLVQCVRTTAIMPRFKEVRLIWSRAYRIEILWPTVKVFLPSVGTLQEMPPRGVFSADRLVISVHFSEDYMYCLKWVKKQTLRSLHVGEQCFSFFLRKEIPDENRFESKYCMVWDCILHDKGNPLCKVRMRCRRQVVDAKGAVCPNLQQLSVRCHNIFERDLEVLISLGLIRDLQVMCCGIQTMSFVSKCPVELQALTIKDYPFWMLFDRQEDIEEVSAMQDYRVSP